MPNPSFPPGEVERAAHLYTEAVEGGAARMGTVARAGTVSAIAEVMAATGWGENSVRRRLRHAAHRGLIGGPAIPDAAVPPDGFAVTRNSGEYDADGALRRQWIETKRDGGEVFEVPRGHVVKGESALVDPEGRVLAKWIKTRDGATGAGLVEALQEAFADFKGAAPVAPKPALSDDDMLTIYPLPDLHLGMLAWGRETGDNYDLRITVKRATESVQELVEQSRPSKRAVILGLGDYFHANDAKAVTPGSGHSLDVDGRWPKQFAAGARLAVAIVDIVARKHENVEVVFLPGNHDPDAAMSLTVALALFFDSNPRISVYQEPGIAWYRRFGKCLFGATHGHTMKPDRMAMMLATDRAEDWGQTLHRNFFFGHIHTETARGVGPVRVESFETPASRDGWNAASGYRSGRSMTAITFHREEGEKGRHRVNIITEKAAA